MKGTWTPHLQAPVHARQTIDDSKVQAVKLDMRLAAKALRTVENWRTQCRGHRPRVKARSNKVNMVSGCAAASVLAAG